MAPPSQPYVHAGQPLNDFLRSFWQRQIDAAEQETPDYRHPPLPLARIKKVMKSDPDVKMISADAPILFCKACEIFIAEITSRAFIIADSNKRRTLSRSDIAKALSKSDQFDFLIDIVPRESHSYPANGKKEETLKELTASTASTIANASTIEAKPQLGAHGEVTIGSGSSNSEVLEQLENLLNGGTVSGVPLSAAP
ncbi:histone-fold-containing protein [Dendrothele bispora CBS 962.96]|uniref:Histone-fold-containing protein n=1 Tax=Dendrothele bispora (strain CBS 962.96) TaxID=1314807 RepID=A0A4S8LM20_DENBC|nr:histone-fold-containing protein [Dendrothele bispora CBS 962.96]